MDKAELIEKLQNLKGLSERQAKLVQRMIDRLLTGKRDPSLSGEADRKVMNCINAPDPIAEVMGFGANPSSAELDLEMAESILREQREGSSHREIAEAVGCRPEVVGATLKAHGIKSKSGTERMRAAINLEPVVDLVFIYCDAEIQVAVISQARLKQLGIDLGKILSKKGGATITVTEACSDRILLADFGMALRHIETAQLCGNRKVDHEARMIRLSRHSVGAGNDSLILFHTASGRSEVDLPWLKELFPGVGCTFYHADPWLQNDAEGATPTGLPEASEPRAWHPERGLSAALLQVMGCSELTRLGPGMFPSLEDAVQSIPTSRPSPSPAPFYWGLPQIKRDELLWKRIKSDRESRKHGFVFGFSQSGWRAYSTKHSFRVGKSNPPYQFTYSDLLDEPKGRAKSGDVQFVVSPRPVDWEGRFRLAPLGTSRPTGDWIKTATVDSATVTTVFLPSLTEITFRTLASRAFAAQASALRNNSRRSGDRESASEGAKFWVQKPFDVADDLQKLPPGDVARREMAVGLGLNTFGVDLVLANLAPADRKYCRGLAMEVNGNVLMHLNLHQKRLVGILMKEYDGDARLAEEMYDKATLAFASSNYLVVRSVLTEAWMAFATRVEKAAADGIALLGEKVAAEALLQKYGFGNSWPVLELDDARLMGTFSRYLAGYARRERPDPKTSNPRTLETLSADQAEEWDTKEDYQQKLVALLQQLHRVFVDGIPEDKREKCRIAVIDAELQAESGWVEELAKADTIDPLNRVKIHTFITRLFN